MSNGTAPRLAAYALSAVFVLLGAMAFPASVEASPCVDGHVYYSDGFTGVEGADMKYENLTNGEVATNIYETAGGHYYAYFPTSVVMGDVVEITARKGEECGRIRLTIEQRPQDFEVILGVGCNPIPTMNSFGSAALVLLLAALGALWIRQKRGTA